LQPQAGEQYPAIKRIAKSTLQCRHKGDQAHRNPKKYGTVWFNEEGIANILSMALVKKKLPVKFDSTKGDHFVVSKPKKYVIFAASASGLYYHDTKNRAVVMVNTVKSNQEGPTDR
jgi:hypothetical protein